MALETISLEHVPATYKVHLALFRNVANADFLHKQLLSRNAEFEYAFIDASVVFSRLQLLAAVFKAVTGAVTDSLRTPNVHSETVLSLSASNNIADAYRRYGISPQTKSLIVVKITFPPSSEKAPSEQAAEQIWAHLSENVQGDACPVTDEIISQETDMSKVKKYYKLNGLGWLDAVKDETMKRRETQNLIMGAMALRGV